MALMYQDLLQEGVAEDALPRGPISSLQTCVGQRKISQYNSQVTAILAAVGRHSTITRIN